MPGNAVWTVPRDWTNGETVTDTLLNTHVRDNLTYLKAVLDGQDLQNVSIHANRLLLHGGKRLVRHPYNAHVKIVFDHVNAPDVAPNTEVTLNVTFAEAFGVGQIPRVVACQAIETAGTAGKNAILNVGVTNITNTGCTLVLRSTDAGAGTITGAKVMYIAVGVE